MDKNWNNLIYANSFSRNKIDAYENASHNCWNTTVGNYYSNYKGDDLNGDGIGDSPYPVTAIDADSKDYLPLMQPYVPVEVDVSVEELRSMARTYARYHDEDAENALPYKVSGGIVVIESRRPTRPPKWPSTPSNRISF
jgi:nitrous oxidase accessory protein